MTSIQEAPLFDGLVLHEGIDERTSRILEHRRRFGAFRKRGWLLRRYLLAADIAGLLIAMLVAETVVTSSRIDLGTEIAALVASLPGWIVIAKLYGLYDRDEERTDHSTADEFSDVFHMITVCTFLFWAFSRLSNIFHPTSSKLLIFWAAAVVLVSSGRALARGVARRSLAYLQNAVIVGAGEVGQTIARKVLQHPEYGVNLVGFIDAEPTERGRGLEHLSLLGDTTKLPEVIRLLDIERVIIAFSREADVETVELVRSLNDFDVQIDIVPRLFELIGHEIAVHSVEGVPLLSLPPVRLARSSRFLKRCFDLLLGIPALIVLAPVFGLIALLIRLDSPGPAFFRQLRVRSGDRTFHIVKFRSMVADADARKTEFAHLNKHNGDGGDPRMFKIDEDPRVTRVGRVLRRFSIDELPQLWNVVRGEMSLVGARPLILDEHAHVTGWATRRLDLRPGMTGLWQVLGRDEIPFDEMVKLDYLYVSTWSLGGDLRLLLRTLPKVAKA
jgi:exopolysaccharide biosynthesis polyprenyl glycosylphosphotransferase